MLDLSKPLGSIEGLTLYGDHQDSRIVYYLPDEVGLRSSGENPDIALQVFFEDAAVMGDADLEGSVGSILGLGVRCGVSPERLDEVRDQLRNVLGSDDFTLTIPPWEQGRVDLILLDAQASTMETNEDSMVTGVVGSRAPSLADGELTALFHARLDRRGTALMAAALEGQVGSLVGVIYDLKFQGLTPAVDLYMRADLDACAEAFSVGAGVNVSYLAADIQSQWGELEQEGAIEIDLISQVSDAATQKLVDEAVQDFYDTLMRELFRPTVPPMALSPGSAARGLASVHFTFGYVKTDSERLIEVDYRKRMARLRTHNPQSHLGSLRGLAEVAEVVQRVPLSTAWQELEVEAALPGGLSRDDLVGVSLVLWRGRDGVLDAEAARESGLRMPTTARPLTEFSFVQGDDQRRLIRFVLQPDEPPYYFWQAKLIYAPDDQVDSPLEIWSEPQRSTSRDLDIFPHLLVTTRRLHLQLGGGHPEDLSTLSVAVQMRAADGSVVCEKVVQLSPESPEARWTVRRPKPLALTVEAALTFLYDGGRRLALPSRRLIDSQLMVNTPFNGVVSLTPVLSNARSDVLGVDVEALYENAPSGYVDRRSLHIAAGQTSVGALTLPVLHAGDAVQWKAVATLADGTTEAIAEGRSLGGTLGLDLARGRVIRLQWLGSSLADEELRYVRVRLRARDASHTTVAEEVVEWNRATPLDERTVIMPRGTAVQWRVEKRSLSGQRSEGAYEDLIGDLIAVAP